VTPPEEPEDLSRVFGPAAAAQRREQLGGILPRRTAVPVPPATAQEPGTGTAQVGRYADPVSATPVAGEPDSRPGSARSGAGGRGSLSACRSSAFGAVA
jgi:hypothetical protein